MPKNARKARPAPAHTHDGAQSELSLRFTPTTWAKLLHFSSCQDNEVGGFGITSPDDLLLVQDFIAVKQEVTACSVLFDDEAVADFFDEQTDLGRRPEQFARLWLHTHPGRSPEPSQTDEETFARAFGRCDWAVMFILARDGSSYARLRFSAGPGGSLLLPVSVDFSCPFPAADHESWEAEYKAKIRVRETELFGLEAAQDSHDASHRNWAYEYEIDELAAALEDRLATEEEEW